MNIIYFGNDNKVKVERTFEMLVKKFTNKHEYYFLILITINNHLFVKTYSWIVELY